MALEVGSRLGHYVYDRFLAGEEVSIMPSRGSNAVPVAFNPNTGLVYTSSWNVPRIQKIAPMEFALGRRYTGVARRAPVFEPGDVLGHFVAINPLTGEKKWEVPLIDFPSSAGTLATGGGLVFTGKITGEFLALDEDTGKTLWQFKTGSSVNSTAITYTHNGQQYVSVASGLGGGRVNKYARGQVPTSVDVDVCLDAGATRDRADHARRSTGQRQRCCTRGARRPWCSPFSESGRIQPLDAKPASRVQHVALAQACKRLLPPVTKPADPDHLQRPRSPGQSVRAPRSGRFVPCLAYQPLARVTPKRRQSQSGPGAPYSLVREVRTYLESRSNQFICRTGPRPLDSRCLDNREQRCGAK